MQAYRVLYKAISAEIEAYKHFPGFKSNITGTRRLIIWFFKSITGKAYLFFFSGDNLEQYGMMAWICHT
jgi:hypothetical protein